MEIPEPNIGCSACPETASVLTADGGGYCAKCWPRFNPNRWTQPPPKHEQDHLFTAPQTTPGQMVIPHE